MQRIAYIIPGYGESYLRQRGYKKIGKFFELQGITPTQVEINWGSKRIKSFSNYTGQFLKKFKRPKNTEIYILGFSFGAMIAFLTATRTKPKGIIFCSLSPYFKEDLKNLKPSWVKWWKKNFAQSDYSFDRTASKIKTKSYFLVGEKEDRSCLIRAKSALGKSKKNHLLIIKGAEHRIGQKQYLKAVQKIISEL